MKKIIAIVVVSVIILGISIGISQERSVKRPDISIPGENQETVQPPQNEQAGLPIFGHNLFLRPEYLKNQSIGGGMIYPGSYKLGTGDRLAIFLLGKSQQKFEIIVNVEGKIYIPTVGVLQVAGMSMDQFQSFLTRRLSKYYDNFSLNLMLIEPKTIPVMVVGDVKRPGKYFINALNTVLDAVILTGGPTTGSGSLRNIEVYRQDKLIKTVDLYQFLMRGEIQNEISLQQYDKIVVPLIQDLVSITGEVKRKAKFELKSGGQDRLSDLIYLAGGFTDLAYLDKIEISRLMPNGERTVFYVDYHSVLKNDSSQANVVLNNDDRIHVFSILDQTHPKYVFIHGEVKHPGKYPLEENLHVRDLILKAGNLTRSAFTLEGEVAKIDPKMPTQFKKIKLQTLN